MNMENCSLCLKLNTDYFNYLDVYETRYGKYHVVSLIEKHLWPVTVLKSQSQWICSRCWKALLEFHQFYRRIEDAQTFFDHQIKSEHITTSEHNLFEVDNETVETTVVSNEIYDEESLGEIDNSASELYSALFQDEEKDDMEVHPIESNAEIMNNFVANLFKCHTCEKLFRNQEVFEKHTAWHQGTVCSCEICDLKFFDLSTLIQHKKVHVPNEKILKLANEVKANNSFVNVSCRDFEYMETYREQDKSSRPPDSNVLPLACTYCSMIVSQQTMERHIAWHRGNIKKCYTCDLIFFNEEKYRIHNMAHKMKGKHIAIERGFQCKYCINIYDDKKAYLNHISWHEDKIYYCTTCDLKFLNPSKFYHHKSSHDLNNTQTLDINSESEGSQHEKSQTDVNQPYQEEQPRIMSKTQNFNYSQKILEIVEDKQAENKNNCQVTSDETDLSLNEVKANDTIDAQDIEVSNGDILQLIEVECTICYKVLKSGDILSNHMAWHEDNVFHCNVCELKFFDKTAYENHYAAHANDVEDSDDNIESEYFICSICSKVLKSRRHFLNHNAWHLGTINACDICDLQFLDKTKYEDHKKTHLPKAWKRCRDCGKAFECARFVKRHWEKMHRNKFIKICEVCGMVSRCPLSFKRHTDRHRGKLENKRIPCDICGRLLKGKAGIKSHKRINHPENGILPYVCQICLKPIATRALLTSHINSRHGPKDSRYKCLVCDKIFRNISQLKSHSEVHNSTELEYPCQWCSKIFTRSSMLSRHRKKVHPKEYEERYGNIYLLQKQIKVVNKSNC